MSDVACLDRLLTLADFQGIGGPTEACRALRGYLAPRLPGCGCLLLNTGPGAARAWHGWTASIDAILRAYRNDESPGGPAGAITYANRYFFSRRQRSRFITALAVSGRPERCEPLHVNASHLPPLCRRGRVVPPMGAAEEADIPIGVEREHRWANRGTRLETGDLLVLYTDGVTEARNDAGQMFGMAGIARALDAAASDAAAALDCIRDALFEHQGREIGLDDQTLLVVRQDA